MSCFRKTKLKNNSTLTCKSGKTFFSSISPLQLFLLVASLHERMWYCVYLKFLQQVLWAPLRERHKDWSCIEMRLTCLLAQWAGSPSAAFIKSPVCSLIFALPSFFVHEQCVHVLVCVSSICTSTSPRVIIKDASLSSNTTSFAGSPVQKLYLTNEPLNPSIEAFGGCCSVVKSLHF